MTRLRVAFAMSDAVRERVFPAARLAEFSEVANAIGFLTEYTSDAARETLAQTEVLITAWGAPELDAAALDAAPHLRAVLHAAGTVKPYLSEGVFSRGIRVSSAAAANAIPVAEYTVAMIVLANKRVLPIAARYRVERAALDVEAAFPGMGNYAKRVGIVGASTIGRIVMRMLRSYDLDVVVYDPFVSAEEAAEFSASKVELDELLRTSDVVSVHVPSLPSTENLIDAAGIRMLRDGATLINTARGEVIDQAALTDRVVDGEISAILDVTTPWILGEDHPLYTAEGAFLTPHIAGSLGTELGRLAETALSELQRLRSGQPLQYELSPERFLITA